MHTCVSKLTITGSNNGLSPGQHQAIFWTNAGILSIGPLGTNFSEIFIIQGNAFENVTRKLAAILSQPQKVKIDCPQHIDPLLVALNKHFGCRLCYDRWIQNYQYSSQNIILIRFIAETKFLPNLQALPDEIILLNIVFVTLSEGIQIPGLLSPWHVLKDLAILTVFAK